MSLQEASQPGAEAKALGIRQMVEQIKKLSDDKRYVGICMYWPPAIYLCSTNFERAETSDASLKLLQSDYDALTERTNKQISSLEVRDMNVTHLFTRQYKTILYNKQSCIAL